MLNLVIGSTIRLYNVLYGLNFGNIIFLHYKVFLRALGSTDVVATGFNPLKMRQNIIGVL